MSLYKLFKNGNVKVLLDMSYNMDDIIDSLGYCIDGTPMNYSITENDIEIAHIRTIDDYVRLKYIDNPKVLRKEKI
jgi:hypothetical protein